MDVIKVKAVSRTAAVAGAIAGVIREHKHAEVQAIGAGAVKPIHQGSYPGKKFFRSGWHYSGFHP